MHDNCFAATESSTAHTRHCFGHSALVVCTRVCTLSVQNHRRIMDAQISQKSGEKSVITNIGDSTLRQDGTVFNPGFEQFHSSATSGTSVTSTPISTATSPCASTAIDTVANSSIIYDNGTHGRPTLDQTGDEVNFFENSPSTIAHKLLPSAVKWNAEYHSSTSKATSELKQTCSSRTRGASSKWKQTLKNHFVQSSRFDSLDSDQGKNTWKQHLKTAAERTIDDICPLWRSDDTHRATRALIMKESNRRSSPRKRWLEEKAHAWLKCLPTWPEGSEIQIEHHSLHPGHAISVAHHIFLGSRYNLSQFIKDLRKKGNIKKLISAHDDYFGDESGRQVFG